MLNVRMEDLLIQTTVLFAFVQVDMVVHCVMRGLVIHIVSFFKKKSLWRLVAWENRASGRVQRVCAGVQECC